MPSSLHGDYDAAVDAFAKRMARGAGKANQAMVSQQYDHPAWGRPGKSDPAARLEDMDTDGVDADVLYCEVSAYRYLYQMNIGRNTTLDDLVRRDATPQLGVMVPLAGMSAAEALGTWMLTGVLERHPSLKIVFVEPGLGWVASYLYIVDDMATRQKYDFPEI